MAVNVAALAGSFVVNLAANYLLSRLTAPDGPRLKNLEADGGDYGVPMARGYGERVRVVGAPIVQDDIDEDKHKVDDYSTIVGAVGGAIQVRAAGPVGMAVGAVVGGLLGAATPNQYYYTYAVPAYALFFLDRTDDDPVEGIVKMWANGKLLFRADQSVIEDEEFDVDGRLIWRTYGGPNKNWRSMTFYTGHPDQPVDPNLADRLDEDVAYIHCAYCVIKELELGPYGNTIPTIDGLIQVRSGQSVAEAAESICAAAGIDPIRNLSTTALTSNTLRGYTVTDQSTCFDALKPLFPAFAVDAAEVVGQIRFYKRSQTMRSTITLGEMGAHVYGDSPPQKALFKRSTDLDLPRETALTWVDPDRDYQPNTATSRRSEGSAKSNANVSIQLVLTVDEGASTAALMHWDAWLGRTQVSFSLTDAWVTLATGLAYGLPVSGQVVPYRITRKLRGANGIIEVEALSDESVTYTASITGSSGAIPPEGSTAAPDTRLVLMDMPIIGDEHDDYGYYIAMGASAGGWTRGRIEISSDGVTFVTVIDQPYEAPIGDVTGTLAAGTTDGLDDTLDTTTVLTVVFMNDLVTLSSVTDGELDAWANFAYVGKDGLGEYLQFKTATHVSGNTWQLTNLRRGRRGTDHAISTHTSGEEFALLSNGDGVFRIVYPDTGEWGEEFTFRGVTLHQDAADADTQTFTNTGEGKRPFSPVNVQGTWDGSNNLTITWDSRSRLFAGGLGIDDNAEWDIEITSGSGRSDTVVAETFAYSAADQIIDGILPGDSIAGRVRQTSDVKDGRWRNFLLLGPDDTWELEDDLTSIHLEDGATPLALEA